MERSGRFFVFPKIARPDPATDVTLFMDISDRVEASFGELGCLSFTFAPDYATSGDLYVYYTRSTPAGAPPGNDIDSVFSRFTNDNPGDGTIDPATEQIVLEVDQIVEYHNGGSIDFGPDGMLYISLGDGGDDSFNGESQDTTNLLGSILRIDVTSPPADPGVMNYVIPPDNPFVGGGPAPGTRTEIFAYGLRNPFRMSFDPATGFLYTGDVGESLKEEIDIVEAGNNFGWPRIEGFNCFDVNAPENPPATCDLAGLTEPIVDHVRGDAISIIGGYVYRGAEVPELEGMYIYADFVTGNVFGLRYDGQTVSDAQILLNEPGLVVLSLAQDASGEVYVLGNGNILELRPVVAPPPANFPTRLSDIPALLAAGLGEDQTDGGIFPFTPEARLWSDGALKERFIALPGMETIDYRASGGWDLPEGSVLIKNFLLPLDFRDPAATTVRIETRLLIRNAGRWHGFSYEWNGAQTDATLLEGSQRRGFDLTDEAGQPFFYEWYYPARNDCLRCHATVANNVLGLNTAQMNHDFAYPGSGVSDNQLRAFEHIGLFSAALPASPDSLPSSPAAFEEGAAPLASRAQSYLQANCANCHQPGGPTRSAMDLRFETALAEKRILDVAPSIGGLGIPEAKLLAPGDPDRSVLLARMLDLGAHRMPPLGTSRVDEAAVRLVRDWIASMGSSAVTKDWRKYD